MKKSSFVFCFAVAFLPACGFEQMGRDIRRLEKGIDDLRVLQAEQTSRVAAVEDGLREVRGKLEEIEYSQNKKLPDTLSSLKSDVQALRKRVPPPAVVPADLLDEDESRLAEMPGEVAEPLSQSFELIREGKFVEAATRMTDVQMVARGTEYAADSLFWAGVIAEGRGALPEAVQHYLGVVAEFPKHKKAPTALLRQASVFVRLGDSKTAKLTLSKVVSSYPKSLEAETARNRLKDFAKR